MPPNQVDTIYPCPFSKGYGIPTKQAWLMLKIFFIYRFISASLFVMLFFLRFGQSALGTHDAQLYQFTSLGYLGISILNAPFIFRRLAAYNQLAQRFIFTDIVFITILMHASGGVTSGVGGLLAISIAAAGLLIGGRCALLFAALASLAVLAEQVYAMQTHSFDMGSLNYSGLLGISFFAIALIALILAQRVEQSASLARRHAQTIVRLEELNRYIIQHLQSGIMIVDEQQFIVLSNYSALRLLAIHQAPTHLADVSHSLQQAFMSARNSADLKTTDGQPFHARFTQLGQAQPPTYMIFLEDSALRNERVQQSKLASLGRLTASIAHEIRNPLSAIQTHCQRVNNIIEDILKLSRRHPSQKQKIVLDDWLPAYVQEQRPNTGWQGAFALQFKQQDLNVWMDPGHLKQILDNLCSNALKYGRPELGPIRLEADREGDQPCIRVIDHGPGIEQDGLAHLFEPFFTTSRQGTGLGLYISRELAQLNQAELSYAKYQEQTCFTLLLANADQVVIEI